MEKPRARWILAATWGNYLAGVRENPSADRHTQGTHWHMRSDTLVLATDTLALATDTLALATDTLAHPTDTLAHPRRRGCTNEAPIRAGTLSPHRPGTFT